MFNVMKISHNGHQARSQTFATEAEAVAYIAKLHAVSVAAGHEVVDKTDTVLTIKIDDKPISYVVEAK